MLYVLLLMILLMPFEKNPYLYISDSFLGIPSFTMAKLLGLLGLAWASMRVMGGSARLRLTESPQARFFLLLIALVVFGGIASGTSFVRVFRLLAIFCLMPLVLVAVTTRHELKLVLKTATAAMILVFPYALRQLLRFGGRLGVGLYESNYLALSFLLMIPLAFVFARHETVPWKKKFWLMGTAVLVLEVIMTSSRGGFIGLVIVLFLLSVQMTRHKTAAVFGATVLLCAILVLPTSIGERFRSSLNPGRQDTGTQFSDDIRKQALYAGLRMVEAHPMTGVGLGNFHPQSVEYGTERNLLAHNMYLEVAAELGLPALAVFLLLFYATLSSLRRSERLARASGALWLRDLATGVKIGILGYLASATFLSAQFEKFLWLFIFLSICVERVARELRRSSSAPVAPRNNQPQPRGWRLPERLAQ